MIPVAVFEPDDPDIFIGTGIMVREDLTVVADNDDNKVLFTLKDHPKITMDNDGEIYYGIECWWIPVSDLVTGYQINHIMLYGKEAEP